ncbi:hypothetical protein HU200_045679 [Digitaria exilis]|uniref:Reverse transcriptase zinc-binding domain-containing protein n=1 Tax=Digitaria exilis TaxID=1010633 RepID=A0A835B5G5_9POAL|nr:hypothetical protein HU200_045679 [Digitaria exilis]
MSSTLLPKTIINALEQRQRAFLWTGEEKCHGASCLIAWERVCQEKEHGGLGFRSLHTQNHRLLLKFVHKLLTPSALSWQAWFSRNHPGALGETTPDTYLARIVCEELPRYRELTSVRVGNGETTSFWHNRWLLDTCLAIALPALYSHCTRPHALVCSVLSTGLADHLRPRLTRQASEEKQVLHDCLTTITLTNSPDARWMYAAPDRPFSTSEIPRSTRIDPTPNIDAIRIWQTNL